MIKIKQKDRPEFHLRKILPDGNILEIKLTKAGISETLICLKLAEHIILSLLELNKLKIKNLVDNFISKSMELLKCKNK